MRRRVSKCVHSGAGDRTHQCLITESAARVPVGPVAILNARCAAVSVFSEPPTRPREQARFQMRKIDDSLNNFRQDNTWELLYSHEDRTPHQRGLLSIRPGRREELRVSPSPRQIPVLPE